MRDPDQIFESAIPAHLQMTRTRSKRVSENYRPPHQSFSARFEPRVQQVVMAYLGIQFREPTAFVEGALSHLLSTLGGACGTDHWDRATYTDERQFTNIIIAAYWDDPAAFARWLESDKLRGWWEDEARAAEGIGYFREICRPRASDFETLFSHTDREGVSALASSMSDEVQEHGYWGSMRDRIPRSQNDAMEASGALQVATSWRGRRIQVVPHGNLCVIRSGQDWSQCDDAERKMYFDDVEPYLTAGMQFLRDEGRAIGCYSNRFVRVTGQTGLPVDRSYCVGLWRDLADLERWAESHATHLAIFTAAIRHYSRLGTTAGLRAWHEVSVLRAEDQTFEYIGCHDLTGMLAAVPGRL